MRSGHIGTRVVFRPGQRSRRLISAASVRRSDLRHNPLESTVQAAAGRPYRSFRGLLEHLATLPRNQVRFASATTDEPMLTEPTNAQREAFDLIGVPIPLALK